MKSEITELISARAKKNATITPLECPLVWARESNAYDCVSHRKVISWTTYRSSDELHQTDVFDFETGQDLCKGTYYDAAIPIVSRIDCLCNCAAPQ